MAINRSLMERQLRMGGGIMNAVPREQYGLGSFLKKGFNKLKGGVKKIAKSPFGKAAALYFGGNLLQGNPLFGNPFGASNPFQGRITDGIGSFFRNTIGDKAVDKIVEEGGDELFGMGKSFLVGSLLPSVLGGDDGDGGGYQRDIPALRAKLTDSYRNQKTFSDEEDEEAAIAAQVEQDIAGFQQDMNRTNYATGGGRIGYNEGTDFQKWLEGKQKFDQGQNAEQLYREYLEDKRRQKVAEQKTMAANGGRIGFNQGSLGGKTLFGDIAEIDWGKEIKDIPKNLMDLFSPSQIMDILSQAGEGFKQIYFNLKSDSEKEDLLKKIMGEDYEKKAYGGRIGYAFGDVVDQASGIMGLPQRTNQVGVKELDLRDSGGFIPPVGVKEKADDIPAMLSNNEFVFTADAVRGMGDGNVNKGAQRMYDMMKKLEKGGRV